MAKRKRKRKAPPGPLCAVNPEELREGADLTALATAGAAFEAYAKAPDLPAAWAELIRRAAAGCEAAILLEGAEQSELRAFLGDLAALLAATAPAELTDEALAAWRERLDLLLPPGDAPAPAATPEGEAVPEADTASIKTEEDAAIYQEFISEGLEHLEQVEIHALELERQPGNLDHINEIFRPIHSIKGAAGFLGLATTNRLCHELETMLDRGRKRTFLFDQQAIDIVLAGVDCLKKLFHNLGSVLEAHTSGTPAGDLAAINTRPVLEAVKTALARTAGRPVPAPQGAEEERLGGKLVARGLVTEDQVEKALEQQQRPIGQILVEMGATTEDAVEETAATQAARLRGANSIKVDTTKLDALMEMVGELVIAESQVEQDDFIRSGQRTQLTRTVTNLSKITRNLQDMVMAMRMIPLKQTFQRMHRLVRDTAQKTAKEVDLQVVGEETEIDKTVIEEIADPLVHLLRNAVDHGIDPPEQRLQDGKARQGTICLRAYHEGGNVVIEVEDDGQGLDREAILAKARERGLIPDRDAELAESEIHELLFAPGFSTAAVTTDISGRGVGMDVVRRNIERLGGRVEIRSTPGAGTTFVIRLPLTMAIVDGMVVQVGTERFVLPTLAIEESVRPTPDMVSTVRNRGEMIMVRSELLPLLRLHDTFACAGNRIDDLTDALVIIAAVDGRRIGLVVDSLLGQQQVVIKNLGERLRGLRGISGASILGDGRVALILDVAGLYTLVDEDAP